METHSKIIARIKAAREDLDWSQAELSRQMGQASNTIQKIESGFIKNPEKYLPEISKVTGKSLSYFFGEETPELTEFAEKARKYDMLMELLQSNGFLNHTNNSVNSNGGENNVNVGGNGNNVNVNPNVAKIIQELMKKDHEEHQLIMKILELEKDEKDKLFQLYDMLRKKDQ
jgi:transcriptional regulator with XRE-family HTH domain